MSYNSLTLHSPSDAIDDTYELEAAMPHTNFAAIADERPTGDGLEIYEARKISKALRLLGRIKAPTYAKLYDKIETLAKTFDPALVSFNNESVLGFLPLDFSTLTTDTANYPTGIIASRYYVRPLTTIDKLPHKFDAQSFLFTLDLIAKDPRRYLQSSSSQSGAGTITNIGDYWSWPTITITASAAGSATYAIRNDAVIKDTTLTLDLSGLIAADVVVVDMEQRTIKKNGTDTMSIYVSGDYWRIEPGANVVTIANSTNTSTVTAYRRAFSL